MADTFQIRLHPKQMEAFQSKATEIVYGGAAGGGKAVALDTPIPTPSGMIPMRDLRVGDYVYGSDGKPVQIIATSDVETPDECLEMVFDTGDRIVCDKRHLWVTWTAKERERLLKRSDEWRAKRRAGRASRAKELLVKPSSSISILKRNAMPANVMTPPKPTPRTAEEVEQTLKVGVRTNHSTPVNAPVDNEERALPIDPYLFGLWLGDGYKHAPAICGLEEDVNVWMEKFSHMKHSVYRKRDYNRPFVAISFIGIKDVFKNLGVLYNKHIPLAYKTASYAQRLELLRGIMDTDGWAEKDGQCAIGFSDLTMINDTRELVTSLGFKASAIYTKKTKAKDAYRFVFMADVCVFGLSRKASLQKLSGHRQVNKMRYIVEANKVAGVPVKCIQVENEDGIYLVGNGHVVTHNSHLMRVAAISMAYDCPGIQIYLFRRNFPDLEKNHIHGESGLLALMGDWFERKFVKYNASKHIFEFANGSMIFLCHLASKRDLQNYQGAEIHMLLLDEATQFEEDEYRYLRARVRLGGWRPPERWADRLPRVLMSANPGGVGHYWIKSGFVDARPEMEIARMDSAEGGMLRQYIPARLSDNPSMDIDYASKLSGMGNPELVKAWLDGDWNVVAGTALEMLNKKTHSVRRFPVPYHWTRIMSMDWGTAKPFAVVWAAVAEGGVTIKAKTPEQRDVFIPDGALVLYREYYGWNGKEDTGCRMTSTEVAQEIIKREQDEKIDYRVGDSAMWAQTDGPSPQENMYRATNGKFILRQAIKDREMNYLEMRQRIKGDEDGNPMIFIMDDLVHWWRTLPTLQLDETNPEKGPDSRLEDHLYDATAYLVRSRPFKMTAQDRRERMFNTIVKEAKKNGVKIGFRR